jgi:hypothetical protein
MIQIIVNKIMEEKDSKIRGKGKLNCDYGFNEYFEYYLNQFSKAELPLGTEFEDTSFNLNKKLAKKLLSDLNKRIMDNIIENNYEFTIPFRMGSLSIKKRKMKIKLDEEGNLIKSTLPVDYKATKELWEKDEYSKENKIKIYILNEHFDGYRCNFHWEKKIINTSGIKPYCFKPTRNNKRYLAQVIKTNPNIDYYEK